MQTFYWDLAKRNTLQHIFGKQQDVGRRFKPEILRSCSEAKEYYIPIDGNAVVLICDDGGIECVCPNFVRASVCCCIRYTER